MQQLKSIPENYVSTSEWARLNGKTIHQVNRLVNSCRLDSIRIGPKRFVRVDAQPKVVDLTGWITMQEFADRHGLSWTSAQRLASRNLLPTNKVNGRVLIWGDVKIERHETTGAFGKGRVSFRVIQEEMVCQTA